MTGVGGDHDSQMHTVQWNKHSQRWQSNETNTHVADSPMKQTLTTLTAQWNKHSRRWQSNETNTHDADSPMKQTLTTLTAQWNKHSRRWQPKPTKPG